MGGSVGGKDSPQSPDYLGLAREMGGQQRDLLQQQTQANRPNQSTPYAQGSWTQGPNGQWQQSVGFTGPLAQADQSLQQQAASSLGSPLDFSGLQALGTGDEARDQAINAAYGQATSRLDPQWQQREDQTRARLLASGLTEGSAAYNREFQNLNQNRNDAYNQAQFSAIGQGTQAGNAIFNQNLASRQQGLAELLRQRSQPLQDLQAMQGFLQLPGFNAAGQGQADNLSGAAGQQYQADFMRWQQQQQAWSDLIGAGASLGGAALLCDERAKQNVQRLEREALPGVPLATWEYREEYGNPGKWMGVIAQDLLSVHPEAVIERQDGMLMIHPAFAPRKLNG